MPTYIIGFIISLGITILPILFMAKNKSIFISVEAIIIVLGGTVGIAVSSFEPQRLVRLVKVFFVVLRNNVDEGSLLVKEIVELSRVTRGDRKSLQQSMPDIRDQFLRDGVALIVDKIDEEVETILIDRIRTRQEHSEETVNMLRTLGKFPPALGLLATVLSLVTLLEGMGGTSVSTGNLGPAMAVGLVGTLYGIVLANLVFAPMIENLAIKSASDIRNRQIAMLGIILLKNQKSPLVVQESLNAMLRPGERVDVLGVDSQSEVQA